MTALKHIGKRIGTHSCMYDRRAHVTQNKAREGIYITTGSIRKETLYDEFLLCGSVTLKLFSFDDNRRQVHAPKDNIL
jgi:hypothetical protein